jgi:hypothetical protein
MIFNKGSRLSNVKLYIDKTELEIVRHYKYLEIMLSLNGSFTQALFDLTRRGQKAFFKLYLPMVIFSFFKGFRLYKLLIKCESLLLLAPTFLLLLNKPTISEDIRVQV